MRAFELIERLINSDHVEVVVFDQLGELVPCKVTTVVTKSGPKLVIGPIADALQVRAADPLSLNAYQDYAFGEAIYPEHGKGSVQSISLALTGLVGESGKALHSWHDIMRGGVALSQETKDDLTIAIGHAFWYLAATAKELGLSLSQLGAQSIRQARAWRREQELYERQAPLPGRSARMAAAGED